MHCSAAAAFALCEPAALARESAWQGQVGDGGPVGPLPAGSCAWVRLAVAHPVRELRAGQLCCSATRRSAEDGRHRELVRIFVTSVEIVLYKKNFSVGMVNNGSACLQLSYAASLIKIGSWDWKIDEATYSISESCETAVEK